MSPVDATASLIVATLELYEVQLLRGAIRAADAEAGPQHQFVDSDRYCPSAVQPCSPCQESPAYLPRPVYHPTPRYEPRPVLHPELRVEMRQIADPAPLAMPAAHEPSPIQPPWKVLPSPFLPVQLVKVVVYRPEIRDTGRVIDCFI